MMVLYTFIYTNETVREVPAAVVDNNRSSLSREYLRLVEIGRASCRERV